MNHHHPTSHLVHHTKTPYWNNNYYSRHNDAANLRTRQSYNDYHIITLLIQIRPNCSYNFALVTIPFAFDFNITSSESGRVHSLRRGLQGVYVTLVT
jgi:hypothetical protein